MWRSWNVSVLVLARLAHLRWHVMSNRFISPANTNNVQLVLPPHFPLKNYTLKFIFVSRLETRWFTAIYFHPLECPGTGYPNSKENLVRLLISPSPSDSFTPAYIFRSNIVWARDNLWCWPGERRCLARTQRIVSRRWRRGALHSVTRIWLRCPIFSRGSGPGYLLPIRFQPPKKFI